MKESPKEGKEETDLRKNEKDHSDLQASLDYESVMTLKGGFSDDVSTSNEKDKNQDDNPQKK
mgnify:CR=1|jgi:hypothetical protein